MTTKHLLQAYRWMFARPCAEKLNYLLFHCSLHGLGLLNHENSQISGEKFFLRKVLPRYLRSKNPVVIDVGANVGTYCREVLSAHPGALVHCFEPNPATYIQLEIQLRGRATCCNAALSNSSGEALLFEKSGSVGSEHATLYKDVITKVHGAVATSTIIRKQTLDDYCESHKIDNILLFKIDTEGHELQVLQGAKRLLSANKIKCLQIEFNEMNRVSRSFCADIAEMLDKHNLFRLLPNGMIPLPKRALYSELFAFQNLVALPMLGEMPSSSSDE